MADERFLWAVVVEGAVDRFAGRPKAANPYAGGYDSTEAWEYGWTEADEALELRGRQEAARWLGEKQR